MTASAVVLVVGYYNLNLMNQSQNIISYQHQNDINLELDYRFSDYFYNINTAIQSCPPVKRVVCSPL